MESGAGWVNLEPAVEVDDVAAAGSSTFSLFSGRGPIVPLGTWTPATTQSRGRREPAMLGLQHPAGSKAKPLLAELGHPVPEGWTVVQDHVRKGLVVALPETVDAAEALAWLLRGGPPALHHPAPGGVAGDDLRQLSAAVAPRCEHVFVPATSHDPARRPRRLLRVGRAARRPRAAGPAGHRRRRGRAGRQLRGQGLRRAHGDGRARRPGGLCPWRRRRRRPGCRPTPRRARPCSRCSTTPRPLVEGLSIDEAFLDVGGLRRVSGTPAEIAARLRRRRARAGRPADHRRRGPHQVPGQGGQRRWPSPTACWSSPPDGELAFLHPLPVERLWGVGPGHRRQAARPGHPHRRRGRRPRRGRAVSPCSAGRRAATSTPWPTTATPARSQVGRRRRSIGSQCALGRRATSPAEVDAVVVGLVDRVTRRHARRRPGRSHRHAAPALRRLRPGHPVAHPAPGRPPTPPPILAAVRGAAGRGAMPLDRRAGPHPRRRLGRQPRRRRRRAAPLPVRRHRADALDAALDDVRDRFGPSAVTRAVLLGRDPGITMPMLPD